jgi:polar amino acid transport system substrate-binding protein
MTTGPVRRRRSAPVVLLLLTLAAVVGPACTRDAGSGGSSGEGAPSASGPAQTFAPVESGAAVGGECTVASFVAFDERLTVLPVGVTDPVPPPWLVANDPGDPGGFHAALVSEVARRLGYLAEETTWTRVPRDEIVAEGPKRFIVSPEPTPVTAAERELVDVTTPYFEAPKALLTSGDAVAVTRTSDLAGMSVAVVGDEDLASAVQDVSAAGTAPRTLASVDSALAALEAGAVDAAVVDLPAAAAAVSADPDLRLAALLPPDRVPGDDLGLILQKDSVFTQCFDDAVLLMTADGTLTRLVTELLQPTLPPVLE